MFSYDIQTPAGTVPNVWKVDLEETVDAWFNENKDSCMTHYDEIRDVARQYSCGILPTIRMHDILRCNVTHRIELLTNNLRKYGE